MVFPAAGWKLKRVNQCAKCPWKIATNPHEIPDGYSVELHQALAGTIAKPGSLTSTGRAMACHEHASEEQVHCVGWLVHQIGPGNNIPLRLLMRSCQNAHAIKVDGPQHERFEDTIPE